MLFISRSAIARSCLWYASVLLAPHTTDSAAMPTRTEMRKRKKQRTSLSGEPPPLRTEPWQRTDLSLAPHERLGRGARGHMDRKHQWSRRARGTARSREWVGKCTRTASRHRERCEGGPLPGPTRCWPVAAAAGAHGATEVTQRARARRVLKAAARPRRWPRACTATATTGPDMATSPSARTSWRHARGLRGRQTAGRQPG